MELYHNEDCTNFFYYHEVPPDRAGQVADDYVDVMAQAGISVFVLNTNARRTNYRSDVWESFWDGYDPDGPDDQRWLAPIPAGDRLRWRQLVDHMLAVHEQGIDWPARVAARCRHHGISPWISLRMNDCHHNDSAEHPFHGRLWRDHPDYVRQGTDGYFARCLDYARPEVRDHYMTLIDETLGRYDIDGLELDFMREPFLFSVGAEREGGAILTTWLGGVRERVTAAAAKRGHSIRLGVRVPSWPEAAIGLGLDVPAWAAAGLIDLLVVTPRWATIQYDIPVDRWRQLLGNNSVTLAAGLEVNCRPRPDEPPVMVSPALAAGAAVAAVSCGADALYLFNYFQDGFWPRNIYLKMLNALASPRILPRLPRRIAVTYREVTAPDEDYAPPLPATAGAHTFALSAGPVDDAGAGELVAEFGTSHAVHQRTRCAGERPPARFAPPAFHRWQSAVRGLEDLPGNTGSRGVADRPTDRAGTASTDCLSPRNALRSRTYNGAFAMIRLALPALLLYVLITIAVHAQTDASARPRYDYTAAFDAGSDGWQAQPGAVRDAKIGRRGGSLKLSTYMENGRSGRWESPPIPLDGAVLNVGAWAAQNMIFAQDPYYCGILAAVFLDAADKPVGRVKLIDFVKEERISYFQGPKVEPDGLAWRYFNGLAPVPNGARNYRLVFAWSNYFEAYRNPDMITGSVWLDDVTVTHGETTGVDREAVQTSAVLPLELALRTAADINMFTPSEPLEFDILVYGSPGTAAPAITAADSLHFEVTDFQHLQVAAGRWPIGEFRPYQWGKGEQLRQGSLTTVRLDDSLRDANTGRWLALEVKLVRAGAVLATGDIAFLPVHEPEAGQDPAAFRFLSGTGGGAGRRYGANLARHNVVAEPPNPWNLEAPATWMEKWNNPGITHAGWDVAWGRRMSGPDSPVDFSDDQEELVRIFCADNALNREVTSAERWPAYMHSAYLQQQRAPEWAVKPVDGKWSVDPEIYARYYREVVRHTPFLYYCPFCQEGPEDYNQRYAEVVVATSRAIKEVDPRVQIYSLAHIMKGKEAAAEIPEDILEVADIFGDDLYNMRVNALPFKAELARRGYPNKQVWVPEYGNLALKDQVAAAAACVRSITYAFAHGVDKLRWWSRPGRSYNMANTSKHWRFESLRGSYDYKGDISSCAGWRTAGGWPSAWNPDGGYPRDMYWSPFLEFVALHLLHNYLGYSTNGQILDFGADCEAYLWHNERLPGHRGQPMSVLAAFTKPGKPARHVAIGQVVDGWTQDLYGRRTPLHARDGEIWMTLSQEPVLAAFSGAVETLNAKPAPVTIATTGRWSRGVAANVEVTIDNEAATPRSGVVRLAVDPRWRIIPAAADFHVPPGQSVTLTFRVTPPAAAPLGDYPLFVDLSTEAGRRWGRLVETISLVPPLELSVVANPAVAGPARILAHLDNSSSVDETATLSFVNPITAGWRPDTITRTVTIPAGTSVTETIALDGAPVTCASYVFDFHVRREQGESLRQQEELFFVPVPRVPRPITVDADPSDWDLEKLRPLRYTHSDNKYGGQSADFNPADPKFWRGPEDSSVNFYMAWDEMHLYWLALITDDVLHNEGELSGIWPYDCLHLCIYPWGLNMNENARGVAYKDHCGLDGQGRPTIDRVQSPVQSPPGGAWPPPNTRFAARRIAGGYILECAYGREAVAPLNLAAGSRFRMTYAYCDTDNRPDRAKSHPMCGWFQGIANVDGNIRAFGELTLVEEQP